MAPELPTFVATARLDDEASRILDRLRKAYFPPHRNFLEAHVTLFHKLSAESVAVLEGAAAESAPRAFEASLSGPFSLGRGVAIRVESEPLVALRRRLATLLLPDLSAQDRQPYRPHVTIQNKVTPEEAGRCLAEVRQAWLPMVARVEAIDLWEYRGGPWEHHAGLSFPE